MTTRIIIGAIAILAVGIFVYLGYLLGQDRPVTPNAPGTEAVGSKVLNLSGKNLTSVGPDIYNKTETTDLVLSNNRLRTLPSEMGRMVNLLSLRLDHNQLDGSLIAEVRLMSQLKTLNVSYNNMTGMPAEIGQLSKLEVLNYSYNHITGLPNELANLKNNLKTFDLTGNPLSASQISALKNELPNTTILY